MNARRLARGGPEKAPTLLTTNLSQRYAARPCVVVRVVIMTRAPIGAPEPNVKVRWPLVAHPHLFYGTADRPVKT